MFNDNEAATQYKMAHTSSSQYLKEVEEAIANKDGDVWAELISYKHPHVANPRLQLENGLSVCQRWFEPPYDEMIAAHLRGVWAVSGNDYSEAYAAQTTVVQNFLRIFQAMKEENWVLPVLYTVAVDLRRFALNADRQLAKLHRGKYGENLEKAAESLMNMFRACVSDTRAPLERSKKWGMLGIVNQLFKIYFKINKLQLCKPMIRAIDSLAFKDQFKTAHLVTYRFFVGKKALFDSDYKLANEYLSYAFDHCHRRSKSNKRLILIYLLPVKMQLGRMPSKKLLVKYGLDQFIDIARAVCIGNLLLLNQALEQHQTFFIRSGIYLILEKLKIITYRNLFKKTFLLMNTHQLPIEAFRVALHHMGATDVDIDEVHCILANLIHLGYLKGYISYQHQKLVVSKKDAFPSLSAFL